MAGNRSASFLFDNDPATPPPPVAASFRAVSPEAFAANVANNPQGWYNDLANIREEHQRLQAMVGNQPTPGPLYHSSSVAYASVLEPLQKHVNTRSFY